MRVIFLLSLFLFSAKYSFSQQAPDVDVIKLEQLMMPSTEQAVHKKAESTALNAAIYILSTPFNKTNPGVVKSSKYVIAWMTVTPDYKFALDDQITRKLIEDNEDLFVLYSAAMVKYCIENKSADGTTHAVKLNAVKTLIKYCEVAKNNISLTGHLKEMSEANKKGELEKFLSELSPDGKNTSQDDITRIEFNNKSAQYDVTVETPLCDFKEYLMCYRPAKIMIMRKGSSSPFQTITEFITISDEPNSLISFEDFNFDGSEDLAIKDILNESMIYLYDKAKGMFILNQALTAIAAETYSFKVSPSEKKINADYQPDYNRETLKTFTIVDNKPVLVSERISTFDIDPLNPVFNMIRKELVDNQWKTTVNKITRKESPEIPLIGKSKAIEKTEIVNVPGISEKFDVTIELPCVRPKGKKNELLESNYVYVENKPAMVVLKNKATGEPFQRIKAKGVYVFLGDEERSADGTFTWQSERQHWVKFQDLNFDGMEDLMIIKGTWEDVKRYEAYLYSKNENQFVYSSEVTALLSKGSENIIPGDHFELSIDPETKTLTVHNSHGDGNSETRSYRFTESAPELVKVTRVLSKWTITKELVRGEWVRQVH